MRHHAEPQDAGRPAHPVTTDTRACMSCLRQWQPTFEPFNPHSDGIQLKLSPFGGERPSRRVLRDVNEDARDIARRKMKTKIFLKSRDQRKRVEMRFAHLKTHHGFERGPSGARDEFHLADQFGHLDQFEQRIIAATPTGRRQGGRVAVRGQ